MRTLLDDACREEILARLRGLVPAARARWGRMDAPRMIAHLTDQMRHALGDSPPPPPIPGPLRWRLLRHATIYWVPWPRGRIQGPPEAFTTRPAVWADDLARLLALVERFAARDAEDAWPEHAMLGHMSGRDWGAFCYKHFDHHLRQFGR